MFRRPLRRLESVVYICIFGVLAGLLLDRLLGYAELAERAAMQSTVARLQAGLYLRIARSLTLDRAIDVRGWDERNPFELADERPPHYRGELAAPDLRTMERPAWFFDSATKEIVYLPDQSRYLTQPQGDPPVLRFRLILREISHGGLPASLAFEPTEPIIWGK